ncbi:MAG: LPS-assembly protein LptD, partial [Nitrospira sp.]|nr:LPS-assembly protein LptD [Nitrospira sp.]
SRLYLLSQYWIDLEEKELRPAPQKLPEAGYVLNPKKVGPFWIDAQMAIANFWRDEGVMSQRLDIFPRILHIFGSDVVVSQTLGLRETAYALHRSEDKSIHREVLEYSLLANTRFLKRYGSFAHVVEPSLGYLLITDSADPPLFDSTELLQKTSRIELALLNRFLNSSGEVAVIRASQGYDANLGDRPFLPFKLEAGIKKPLELRLDATYDVHEGKVEGVNSEMRFKLSETTLFFGQRYNRQEDITVYKAGVEFRPSKPWNLRGRIWYDASEKEVQDITLEANYISQCWGLFMTFNKKPHDFSVSIRVDLMGLTRGFKM